MSTRAGSGTPFSSRIPACEDTGSPEWRYGNGDANATYVSVAICFFPPHPHPPHPHELHPHWLHPYELAPKPIDMLNPNDEPQLRPHPPQPPQPPQPPHERPQPILIFY